MLGLEVNKTSLDTKFAQTALKLRSAFDQVETVAKWLANHPVVNSVDPLTEEPYNYTADEAYVVRVYFETFDAIRADQAVTFDYARKMTGLE